MNFPKNLMYTKTHEWVLFAEDGTATVGITDYAQDQLGDRCSSTCPRQETR